MFLTESNLTTDLWADPTMNALADARRSAAEANGFHDGYAQAVRDMMSAVVVSAERVLQQPTHPSPELRNLIYLFVATLQREAAALTPSHTEVEGGLGI